MRYQHLKIVKKVSRYLVPLIPVGVALLLAFSVTDIPQSMRSFGHMLATPFWSLQTSLKTAIGEQVPHTNIETLEWENATLREELTALKRSTYVNRSLEEDNNQLRELLNRSSDNTLRIPTAVIHNTNLSPYDTFVIDRGARHGLRDGMLIVTDKHIAVGFIATAHERTSTVTLFSMPQLTFNALVRASTTQSATINGLGSGTMRARVPRDIGVSEGDEIALPTFETYVIGTVVAVEVSPEDAFKNVFIQAPINMYELRFVFVDTTSVWNASKTEVIDTEI
jgi:cell shape-determining protein MreC